MSSTDSPFSVKNVRLFLWFRILFNARFYYPIFTVLFLDYGLTLAQFAILNMVWAVTIVLFEVPSGAMADTFGRKKLVVFATATMVVEMLLLGFVPLGNNLLVFSVMLANRLLSGFAEAMASGADEALAYDSLAAEGKESLWSQALAILMRRSATAMMIAMLIGGAVYDAEFLNKILAWCSVDFRLDQSATMRFPIYLTLLTSIVAFILSWQMVEVKEQDHADKDFAEPKSVKKALALTRETGQWIAKTPLVFLIILIAMSYDSVGRMFMVLASEYYRTIGFQEASFGMISAGVAVSGIVISKFAPSLTERFSMSQNFIFLGAMVFINLWMIRSFENQWGVIFAMSTFSSIFLLNFFVSHYLNQQVPSKKRATALSFRSMACNLSYAAVGAIYAWYSATTVEEEDKFFRSLNLLPLLFLTGVVITILYATKFRKKL